jgi:hypothetical protein
MANQHHNVHPIISGTHTIKQKAATPNRIPNQTNVSLQSLFMRLVLCKIASLEYLSGAFI